MNKILKRVLVFIIGIPVVFGLCLFYFKNHILINIAAALVSGICAFEFSRMAEKNVHLYNKVFIIALTVLQPVITYLLILFKLDINLNIWLYLFEIILVMAVESFSAKTFEDSLKRISITALIIFYCGYMISFITRLTALENPVSKHYATWLMVMFFIIVFLCDSAAWLFGVLWGKTTRGYIAASPNKSIVGFLGGIAAGIFFALLIQFFLPEIFGSFFTDYWKAIIIGFFTAIAAIIGDLIESVFKRSCDVKDSGIIMGGRGGLLDSMDSLLLAAPVYYLLIHFIYHI